MREYSELHIKNKNVKYIDRANRIFFALNTKSLQNYSSCYKAFRCTGWKKQLRETFDEKQRITKNDEAARHEFFQVVKIHIIIRGEVYSVADLRKIYSKIRSERNLSRSTRSIDIRQKVQDMFYE